MFDYPIVKLIQQWAKQILHSMDQTYKVGGDYAPEIVNKHQAQRVRTKIQEKELKEAEMKAIKGGLKNKACYSNNKYLLQERKYSNNKPEKQQHKR